MTAVQGEARIVALRRALVRVLTVEVLALAATGVYLLFGYRPSAAQAWNAAYQLHEDITLAIRVRTLHRWLSWLVVATSMLLATVLFAEAVVRWHGPARRRRGAVTGPLAFVVVVATAITGAMLPWDQVALRAVTVGTNMSGYRMLLDDDRARFVLIGGTEVSLGELRTVLALHALVLPLLLAGLLTFSSWTRRTGMDRQDLVIADSPPEPHTG